MTRMIGRHSNPVGFLLATAAGTSPSLLRGAAAFVFPTIGTASLSRCGSESQRSLSFLSTSTLHYGGSSRATADRTTRPRFGGKEARQRRHCLALLSATSEPAVTGMIEDEVMVSADGKRIFVRLALFFNAVSITIRRPFQSLFPGRQTLHTCIKRCSIAFARCHV